MKLILINIAMDLVELSDNHYRHPWELSRRDSLIGEINRYHKKGKILDVGCGDLYFDKQLVKGTTEISELWGIDIYAEKDSTYGICNWVNKYEKIKPKKFDTILMMDVLEHIEDDVDFLKNTVKPLISNDNGKIILTVPAFQSLFSKHDEALKHYRRYNVNQLKGVCKNSGLRVVNYHYFYFSLLPLRLLTRNNESKVSSWSYSERNLITKLVRKALNLDYKINTFLSPLSLGLSLFAVIEKDN